jgi:L-ascorbate metabolism protein UlaG (beta-lactamase superfamily)
LAEAAGSGISLTWLGHASVLVVVDGVRLLTDPVLRDRVGPLVRVADSVSLDGLGRLDAVLLSHLHADHTDLPSLRRLGGEVPVVGPYPSSAWLRRQGLRGARELRTGETASFGPVDVLATPAIHDHRRRPLGPAAEPVGYVIRGSRSVYFAGDTDLDPAMSELRGSIDVALVPVWGWGPSVGAGHLDPRRAADAVGLIAPRLAIPIHWGTFALPWRVGRGADRERPAAEFAALVARHAPAVEVRVVAPGAQIDV